MSGKLKNYNANSSLLTIGGYLIFSGFVPVLIRLGNGLTKRKIAIFAKGDALSSLTALFEDSDLFDVKNVVPITDVHDIGRAEKASIFWCIGRTGRKASRRS